MKRIYFYILLTSLLGCISCEKWLDIQPKNQVDENELYKRESGFKDVLYGAYVQMANPELYGRELTFGFVDVIGQAYSGTGNTMEFARRYDYLNSNIEPLIAGVWNNSYKIIANLNNLIEHLRTADKAIFATGNYNVLLGEALGLRAFIHFDLLRIFGPSYLSGNSMLAIPYVDKYSNQVTKYGTVSENIESIEADLSEAALLLQSADPINGGQHIPEDDFLLNRNFRFNYFAVQATRARVSLYKGDLSLASKFSEEVISKGNFTWTQVDDIAVTDVSKRDRTFSSEQIFVLNVPKILENQNDRLQMAISGVLSPNALFCQTSTINQLYPEATDIRKLYFWSEELSGFRPQRFCTKLWQPVGIPQEFAARLPLIRLPEMYLISAEANLENNVTLSIERLNEVKVKRGEENLFNSNTPIAMIDEEIYNEYRREFICEGQLFYYCKRKDLNQVGFFSGQFNKEFYVVPKPNEEIEFRN